MRKRTNESAIQFFDNETEKLEQDAVDQATLEVEPFGEEQKKVKGNNATGVALGGNRLKALLAALSERFPLDSHRWRIIATSRNKNGAWIAFYVDLRRVMERFMLTLAEYGFHAHFNLQIRDEGVHANGYNVQVRLTLLDSQTYDGILSIEDFGYAPEGTSEGYKSAATDAYRRVLSHLGVGRYLYNLPRIYISGDVSQPNPLWDFSPLSCLEKVLAMENPDPNQPIFFSRRNEEREGGGGSSGGGGGNLPKWADAHNVEPDEVAGYLKEIYGLRSSVKQIAVYCRITDPDEGITDEAIRKRLDEHFGKSNQ